MGGWAEAGRMGGLETWAVASSRLRTTRLWLSSSGWMAKMGSWVHSGCEVSGRASSVSEAGVGWWWAWEEEAGGAK